MVPKGKDEDFSEKEAQVRFEAALKGALKLSPKPLKDIPKTARQKRPVRKKKVVKKWVD